MCDFCAQKWHGQQCHVHANSPRTIILSAMGIILTQHSKLCAISGFGVEGSEQHSLMQTNTGEMGYENVINMILQVNVNIMLLTWMSLVCFIFWLAPKKSGSCTRCSLKIPANWTLQNPLVLASAAPPRSYFRGASWVSGISVGFKV